MKIVKRLSLLQLLFFISFPDCVLRGRDGEGELGRGYFAFVTEFTDISIMDFKFCISFKNMKSHLTNHLKKPDMFELKCDSQIGVDIIHDTPFINIEISISKTEKTRKHL